MTVDKIIRYGKTRSKVIFDDGFTLILYDGEIRKWHIEAGSELPDVLYEQTILPVLEKRAKEHIVNLLKDCDRPEAVLREKLRDGGCPQSCIDSAIAWAASRHYVDDERYVDTYLRYHSDGRSRKKILYDLMHKGIDRDLIVRMLEESCINEDEQVRKELVKRGYRPDMDPKDRQRIAAALARKGYGWAAVNDAMGTGD